MRTLVIRQWIPWVLVLCLALAVQGIALGDEPRSAPGSDPIEQQVRGLMSDDSATQQASFTALIESADPALLKRLQEIRDDADRTTRLALKPVVDLIKNRLNLTSANSDQRRSAATE